MTNDVLIIGGGAAGLSAALSASNQGARVTVLEAAPRVGRKILASGNGRCNLANTGKRNYPGGGDAARRVLEKCPVEKVLSFFGSLGLPTVEEDQGRVYPACGQAAAVLEVLRFALERKSIPVLTETPVTRMEKTGAGFALHTPRGAYAARTAVAACGGMAGGKLGHDGSAYRLLTGCGHTLIPPRPALSPLTAEKSAVKGLSGLRLPAVLTLCRRTDGTPIAQAQGEMLFTDYGVSGVCAMELARAVWTEKEESGAWPMLYLDFSPMLDLVPRRFFVTDAPEDPFRNEKKCRALLEERLHILPREALLKGLAPRLLMERLAGQSVNQLARSLTAYPVPLTGVKGMENAQVTAGGICTGEFDLGTLESRLAPGLYAAGEMLDVDGACGGFNLQFAFASGLIAGENAGKSALGR